MQLFLWTHTNLRISPIFLYFDVMNIPTFFPFSFDGFHCGSIKNNKKNIHWDTQRCTPRPASSGCPSTKTNFTSSQSNLHWTHWLWRHYGPALAPCLLSSHLSLKATYLPRLAFPSPFTSFHRLPHTAPLWRRVVNKPTGIITGRNWGAKPLTCHVYSQCYWERHSTNH